MHQFKQSSSLGFEGFQRREVTSQSTYPNLSRQDSNFLSAIHTLSWLDLVEIVLSLLA